MAFKIIPIILFLSLVRAHAEVGVTDNEIRIGSTTNLTGPHPARSHGGARGSKTYFEKLNAAGGIHGRKIKYIELDDKYNAQLASENATNLVEKEKVFVLFQSFGTQAGKSVMYVADKYQVPLLFPITGGNFFSYPLQKMVFNFRARYWDEAKTMVDFAYKKGWKKIALLTQPDAAGADQRGGMEKALAEKGNRLAGVGLMPTKYTDADMNKAVDDVIKEKPEVIAVAFLGEQAIDAINKVTEKGYKSVFFCFSPTNIEGFPGSVKDKGLGTYLFQSTPNLNETNLKIVKDFIADMSAAKQAPSPIGLDGYIHAKITHMAMEKVGKDLTRAGLIKALESMNDVDLGGVKFTLSPQSHQGVTQPSVYVAEGNDLKRVD